MQEDGRVPRGIAPTVPLEGDTLRGNAPEERARERVDPSVCEITFLEGSPKQFHDARGAQRGARDRWAESLASPNETLNDLVGGR